MFSIEKYGWKKEEHDSHILFYKGENFIRCSAFVVFHHEYGIHISTGADLAFEELQAIYETAKQIEKCKESE